MQDGFVDNPTLHRVSCGGKKSAVDLVQLVILTSRVTGKVPFEGFHFTGFGVYQKELAAWLEVCAC
jgi:hypothetical protein